MKKSLLDLTKASLLATGAILAGSVLSPALAVGPALQLNVTGGTYIGGDEESGTNVDSSGNTINTFTLNALCQNAGGGPNQVFCNANDYFISIALLDSDMNPIAGPLPDFGSFEFDGTSYNPSDFSQGGPQGLPGHDVFNPDPGTWFTEVAIGMFDTLPTALSADVEDDPEYDPTSVAATDCDPNNDCDLFVQQFLVDITDLSEDYKIHFDLYLKDASGSVPNGPGSNAPFSHDVVSTVGLDDGVVEPPPSNPEVPEPSAVVGLMFLSGALAISCRRS